VVSGTALLAKVASPTLDQIRPASPATSAAAAPYGRIFEAVRPRQGEEG